MCDSSIGLADTLEFIRGRPYFLTAFMEGRYALWVGSGISRSVVPGLKELLQDLVVTLYDRSEDPQDPDDPYRRALSEVLGECSSGIDWEATPKEWDLESITSQLQDRYSVALGVRVVNGSHTEDLVWDVLSLPERFSDPSLTPDAEHYLIAVLLEEGVVSRLVTTNWDPLIERAHEQLTNTNGRPLHVVASADDLEGTGDVFLLKAHGCAAKAHADRDLYGDNFVATELQIAEWGDTAGTRPLKEKANTVLRESHACFIGLSAQDENLKRVVLASSEREQPFSRNPPKVVFTERELGGHQEAILRRIYRDDTYYRYQGEIRQSALLQPCAKPLLSALLLEVMMKKADTILDESAADLSFAPFLRDKARSLPSNIETLLTSRYDGIEDSQERWREFTTEVVTFMGTFTAAYRDQVLPSELSYTPLCPGDLASLRRIGDLRRRGLHWVLALWSMLLEGQAAGDWQLEPPHDSGQVLLRRPDGLVDLWIIDDDRAGVARLEQHSLLRENAAGCVVIYPQGREPAPGASSSLETMFPGLQALPHQIWLQDLADETQDVETLLQTLRDSLLQVAPR